MAASIAGLRRNLKNVAHNYTDAQVKVREATSNDPWGPSSTQMSEIADLTYNVIAFSEIMQMIWKRINDSGKNWRHVYKALVLLEYLIKTGSEKVAQQCRENIFSIQTLKDFQFIEENKDQGLNVREKAKALVSLLKDEEKLKNERVRALKAKERFAQSTAGIGSDTAFGGGLDPMGSPMGSPHDDRIKPDLELARPQTQGEEELQLQLALAMSREEAEAEESKKKSDEMRLNLAIQKSKEEAEKSQKSGGGGGGLSVAAGGRSGGSSSSAGNSALNDLVDLNFGHPAPPLRTTASMDPWAAPPPAAATALDPWGASPSQPAMPGGVLSDPWNASPLPVMGAAAAVHSASPLPGPAFHTSPGRGSAPLATIPIADPWSSAGGAPSAVGVDPWGGVGPLVSSPPRHSPLLVKQDPFSPTGGDLLAGFGGVSAVDSPQRTSVSPGNPWDLSGLDPMAAAQPLSAQNTGAKPKKTMVESLLGEHSNLVNLDNIVQVKAKPGAAAKNPFADQPNPFQAAATPKPTINQLRTGGQSGAASPFWPENNGFQQQQQQDINPFS